MVFTVVLLAGTAAARPPPEDDHDDGDCCTDPGPDRPAAEWSTWFRLGFGVEPATSPTAARSTTPVAPRGHEAGWEAAIGADLTMAVSASGNVRFGPWIEARGLSVIGGAELVVQRVPRKLDMFLYDGQGVLALRAGANYDRVTAQLAYGYLAPWKLWGPWRGSSRYMIGVRFVGTVTRAIDDPRDWSATVGIEAEPFGAIRYLLGIRSWY
jgi:hypothetical protein